MKNLRFLAIGLFLTLGTVASAHTGIIGGGLDGRHHVAGNTVERGSGTGN